MKPYVRILLTVLVAAMILSLPFVLSSGAMLTEAQWSLYDEGEEAGLFSLMSSARGEEEKPVYSLPIDFSAGMKPNPAGFAGDTYQDDSITVHMETRVLNDVTWRIAWVEVASPTQLRTAIAGKKVTSSSVARTSAIAEKSNAIVAINGDYFVDNPAKTSFEYRMGQKIRNKTNKLKDILIIDENGDFHLFQKSSGVTDFVKSSGRTIVNAFTFGPALVIDGEVANLDSKYGYNPSGQEPRTAIGQIGELSYVMVLAEGRNKNSEGVTQKELALFMEGLGCQQAYNLDGGNSATMVFGGEYYQTARTKDNERSISDIIYFASAVDPATWE